MDRRSMHRRSIAAPDVDATLDRHIIESMPDGLIVVGRDGVIARANPQVEILFGYERAALIGRPIEILIPAEARQKHTAHRLRYTAEPQSRSMGAALDLWGLRADGAAFPVEVSLSSYIVDDEQFVIATVRDITARRAAEESMRNLLQMLEGITEAVFLIEPDSLRFVYANAAASTLTGYPESELLEMGPLHAAPDLDESSVAAILEPLLSGEVSSASHCTTMRRRDGSELMVEIDLSLPSRLRGQPPTLVAIVRDITTRLALEAETAAAQALRTMLDDRLRIARDLHDSVIQNLFASGLELQSLAGGLAAESREQAAIIVERLDDTIRQLRVTIFGLSHRSSDLTLLGRIHGIIDEATRVLHFRPLLRMTDAVEAVARSEVAEHLLPTLRESLSNIAHHANASRVEIDLVRDGELVMLTVTDDGIGIPDDRRLGEGLRNMAERAEALGGTFTVQSVEPRGTTLTWSGRTRAISDPIRIG